MYTKSRFDIHVVHVYTCPPPPALAQSIWTPDFLIEAEVPVSKVQSTYFEVSLAQRQNLKVAR